MGLKCQDKTSVNLLFFLFSFFFIFKNELQIHHVLEK